MTKQPVDYHFKAVNPMEYVITASFSAKNWAFERVLNSSMASAMRIKYPNIKDALDIPKFTVGTEDLDKIPVMKQNWALIKNQLDHVLKPLWMQLKEDGVSIADEHLDSLWFEREGKEWHITAILRGNYSKRIIA